MQKEQKRITYIPFSRRGMYGMAGILTVICLAYIKFGNTVESILVSIILVLIVVCLALGTLTVPAYATVDKLGIHILTFLQKEIHVIPWQSVERCFLASKADYHCQPYVVIVTTSTQNITYELSKGYPPIETIVKYRLDEAMAKLAWKRISTEAFDAQGIYFMALPPKKYEQIKCIWKNVLNKK